MLAYEVLQVVKSNHGGASANPRQQHYSNGHLTICFRVIILVTPRIEQDKEPNSQPQFWPEAELQSYCAYNS